MSPYHIENAKKIFSNYEIITDVNLNKKIYLGRKGVCRYCGRGSDLVKFRKIAHAFPELISNKLLFSLDECDECNEYFDKNLENDLANFLGIARTAYKLNGKKGIPKFKGVNGDRVEVIGQDIVILQSHDSEMIDESVGENKLSIKVKKNTHTPIQAYKCFVKMALALLPDVELSKFKDTINWVRQNKKPDMYDRAFIKAYCTFLPGNNPLPIIKGMLFKRKSSSELFPYMFAVIVFGNYMFQFIVPFSKRDKIVSSDKINFVPFPPPPVILPGQMGPEQVMILDLTSEEKTKTDDTVTFNTNELFTDIDISEVPEEIINRISELGLKIK